MTGILYVIGVLAGIAGIVLGVVSRSFWGFIGTFTSGVIASVICFGLAKILENQKEILYQLQSASTQTRKLTGKKTCEKCTGKYDGYMSSCPHCGFKPD